MIMGDMTLADIVKQYPQTIPYLNELHLDYCCNGHLPMEQSLEQVQADLPAVLKELNRLARRPAAKTTRTATSMEAFKKLDMEEMLFDLEETHHVTERKMMEQIEQDLNRILVVHYPRRGEELARIHNRFSRLKAELEEHFAKEERLVFPLMRANMEPTDEILGRIRDLEGEHAAVGSRLKELRKLTDDYRLPEDACATYRRTYHLMKMFTEDVFVHIFKENSIAFLEYAKQKQEEK